ncbi:hypothetical protein OAE37_02820 [Pirellulaceae bacterium]|jgi:hypothetical protein|nr:hypothetical protein [Pirellulaceae bacterium]
MPIAIGKSNPRQFGESPAPFLEVANKTAGEYPIESVASTRGLVSVLDNSHDSM